MAKMPSSPTISLLLVYALAACSFDGSNVATPRDGSNEVVDAAPSPDFDALVFDADPIAPDAGTCIGDSIDFTLLNITPCDPPPATIALALDMPGRYVLNTTHGTLKNPDNVTVAVPNKIVTQVNGPDLFVTSVTSLDIASDTGLLIIGNRPLVLVSTSTITITGRLLARGDQNVSGPGGDRDADCMNSGRGANGIIQTAVNTKLGGSGGGGGGFGTTGSFGSRIGDAQAGSTDSNGGLPSVNQTLVPLRGGCAGGAGGDLGGGAGGGRRRRAPIGGRNDAHLRRPHFGERRRRTGNQRSS